MHVTHRPGLKVSLLQPPLLLVEAIILHILLHHLVFGVKEHVTGRARSGVLHVVHCKRSGEEVNAAGKPGVGGVCGTYVYNRKTEGSDTWWRQTSPQRSPPRWASGSPHIRPCSAEHLRRDLRPEAERKAANRSVRARGQAASGPVLPARVG